MKWSNVLTKRLNISYPVVQAPMLGVSTPEMAAAVAEAGGLGSLAAGGLSPEMTGQLIRRMRRLTDKPFAVNLFAHELPENDDAALDPMRSLLLAIARRAGYALEPADMSGFRCYDYRAQLDVLVEAAVPVVSFTFGCLDAIAVQRLKAAGSVLIGTATCTEEAVWLERQQIDMVVVQGIEAGGHRGTFLEDRPLPQIGLAALLPQVRKAVDMPCIAAGGILDGKQLRAAFMMGADAVQVGTAFIPAVESQAIPAYQQRVLAAKDTDTVLTRAFSGRWARGIGNALMREIEASGLPIPPYPLQHSLTARLRQLAQQAGDSDFTNLWCGQQAPAQARRTSREVFLELIRACEDIDN